MNEFQRIQQYHENKDKQDTRQTLNRIVDWFKEQPTYETTLEIFASTKYRTLPIDTLRDADAFYIEDDVEAFELPQEFREYAYGMVTGNRVIHAGRMCFPIKDFEGNVAGFTTYSNAEKPKYMDTKNYLYKPKDSLLFGSEQIHRAYDDKSPVIVTEGIICSLWLRQFGFTSLAMLGSELSTYTVSLLNRFGKKCVIVFDNDDAGIRGAQKVSRLLPNAVIVHPTRAKDIDDMRKLKDINPEEIVSELKSLASGSLCRMQLFKYTPTK